MSEGKPASFRFKKSDDRIEAGLRRIACEQIDAALAAIRAGDLSADRIVHQLRRRCKAVRALIRLVRPALHGFALENAVFRDIARSLAQARDGVVLVATLDALAGDMDEAPDAAAVADLRRRLARRKPVARLQRQAIAQSAEPLMAARVRAATWVLVEDGWEALAPGLEQGLKRARRTMRAFAATGEADAAHEWRKQVKYHWHHMRLLRALAPHPADQREPLAGRLVDLLGERHDLDLLVAALAAQRPGPEARAAAGRLIASAGQRKAKLDRKALALGKRLFAGKPRKLVARWRGASPATGHA